MRARLPLNTRSGAAASGTRRRRDDVDTHRRQRRYDGQAGGPRPAARESDGTIVHAAVDDDDYDAPTGYDVVDRRSYDGKFATTVPPEDKTTDDDENEGQQHTQGEIDETARERGAR